MAQTYYDVLGVDADADRDEIRDAYREKVKEYHPDVSDHPDAEERFKRVKRAEIVLSDPEERTTYDRLGHETYVDGDDPASNRPTEDEVRWAAAQAANGNHDGGGRSAGWRERERRARRSGRAEWFRDDDSSGWNGGTSPSQSEDSVGDAASDPRTGNGDGSASGTAGTAPGSAASANASGRSTAAAEHVASQAATNGWRGPDPRSSGHAVHEWGPEARSIGIPTPGWTQDDVVLLASSLLLYPILLFLTIGPAFPTIARATLGLCTIALIAFLLPRPGFGLPVFGTWSLLVPAVLLGFEISPISAVGLVALGGVWLPLLYSIAVAMVLR